MRRRRPWSDIFDDMFEDVDRTVDRMFRTAREWTPDIRKEPMIYGFSMEIGPDGIPKIQHFGNIRSRTGMGERVMEPYTSTLIDEENNQIRITADMPGVEKKDISLNATEDTVTINAESEDRKYHKECRMDAPVDPESATATFKNGVLEVTLNLKEKIKPKGKGINIK